MNEEEFRQLQIKGQFYGGLIMLLGVVLMFLQQNAIYFIASFALFWILNYLVIHVYLGNRLVRSSVQRNSG